MLCLYVFALFFLGYEARAASLQNTDHVVHFSDRLANVIEKKCLKNADEDKAEEALNGLEIFIRSWAVPRPDRHLSAEAFYDTCMHSATNFKRYLGNFVDTLKPCLEPQESYLTQFILDSYGEFNHHFCTLLGATVRAGSPTRDIIDKCSKMFDNPEMDPTIACYKNSTILGNNPTVYVVTKKDLCNDISHIYSCDEDMFEASCPDSPEYKNARLILLVQALENCSEDNNNVLWKL